jgi:hypothetical protein
MNGQFPSAPEINIACADVLKLLQKLNPNKAAGGTSPVSSDLLNIIVRIGAISAASSFNILA